LGERGDPMLGNSFSSLPPAAFFLLDEALLALRDMVRVA
jgi:hypothetical protein